MAAKILSSEEAETFLAKVRVFTPFNFVRANENRYSTSLILMITIDSVRCSLPICSTKVACRPLRAWITLLM